jgi:adenylate cyclase
VLGWIADWSSGFREASHAAERAIATDPDNGTALSIAASTLAIAGRLTEAAELARRALQLHPNSCAVRTNCAWALIYNGEYDSALEHLDAARRLSPLDPRAYYTNAATVTAHLFAGRAEEAVKWAERTLERWPEHAVSLRYLAAALASLGRVEEAATAVRRLLAVQPTSTVTRAGLVVYRDASVKAAFLDNLRKAGLPE